MFSVFTHYAWLISQALIGCHILLPATLALVYYVKKIFNKAQPVDEELFDEKDYAIIVSLDKSTEVLSSLIQSLCNLTYSNYLVYVIVNDCDAYDVNFNNDKIVLLRSAKNLTSKVSQQRYAIENFIRSHTHVVVLNSSNTVGEEYLNELNVYFNKGYQAVQSTNTTKKSNTIYDLIDSAGNSYSQFFRGGLFFGLQSSAALTGSGMAFTVSLYKQCLKKLVFTNTRFASALQYIIVNKGHQIAFAERAVVQIDKPISAQSLLYHHAGRIHAWIKELTVNIRLFMSGIRSFNINRMLFSLLRLQFPLLTTALLSIFFLAMNVWINTTVAVLWMYSLFLMLPCFVAAYIYSKDKKIEGANTYNTTHFSFTGTKSLFKGKVNRIHSVAS